MRKKMSKSLRKNKKTQSRFEEKMRKVELLPTRDCEAGYGPDQNTTAEKQHYVDIKTKRNKTKKKKKKF